MKYQVQEYIGTGRYAKWYPVDLKHSPSTYNNQIDAETLVKSIQHTGKFRIKVIR